MERGVKVRNKVSEELKVEQQQLKPSYFWGVTVSIISLLNGLHLLFYEGVIVDRLNAYFLGANEDIFGVVLVLFGGIKLIGVLIDSVTMRAVGIVGLSVIWGMLWVVALMFSFGIGYPNTAYLSNGMMLIACLRVSYRGVRK